MLHASFQRHAALFVNRLRFAMASRRSEREMRHAGQDRLGQLCLRAWCDAASNKRRRKASSAARVRGFLRRVRRVKTLNLLRAWRHRCEHSLRIRTAVLHFYSRALWRLCTEVVAGWVQCIGAQKRESRVLRTLRIRRSRRLMRAVVRLMEQQIFEKHSAMVIASESELVDALVKACAGKTNSTAVFDAALQAIQRTKGLLHLVSCNPIYVSLGAPELTSS